MKSSEFCLFSGRIIHSGEGCVAAAFRLCYNFPMRIGVSTAAYYGRMETEESAAFLASLGVPCCEAFLQTYSEYQPEFGRTLKAAAGKMEIVSAHNKTLHFEGDFLAQSPRQRADGFAMLETFLETAQLLCENGCTITVVEMADEIAPGTWMQHKDDVLPSLEEAGTDFLTGEKLLEIHDGYIITENMKTKEKLKTNCDTVVLSLGSRPDTELIKELEKCGVKPFVIGDCGKIGRIADATKAAYEAAVNIE